MYVNNDYLIFNGIHPSDLSFLSILYSYGRTLTDACVTERDERQIVPIMRTCVPIDMFKHVISFYPNILTCISSSTQTNNRICESLKSAVYNFH